MKSLVNMLVCGVLGLVATCSAPLTVDILQIGN